MRSCHYRPSASRVEARLRRPPPRLSWAPWGPSGCLSLLLALFASVCGLQGRVAGPGSLAAARAASASGPVRGAGQDAAVVASSGVVETYGGIGLLDQRILLFPLSDGSVAAVDSTTGSMKWRSSLGGPLFSSSSSHSVLPSTKSQNQHIIQDGDEHYSYHSSADSSGGVAGEGETGGWHGDTEDGAGRIIPGADGMLYEYSEQSGLQELSFSARELVQASPSVTTNGEVIVGSRSTNVMLLDVTTGEMVHSFDPAGAASAAPATENLQGTFLNKCMQTARSRRLHQQQQQHQQKRNLTCSSQGAKDPETDTESPQCPPNDPAVVGAEEAEKADRLACQRAWEQALFLVRTDYVLKSFELSSGTLKWNLSYGELSPLRDSQRMSKLGGAFGGRGRGEDLLMGFQHGSNPDPLQASGPSPDADGAQQTAGETGAMGKALAAVGHVGQRAPGATLEGSLDTSVEASVLGRGAQDKYSLELVSTGDGADAGPGSNGGSAELSGRYSVRMRNKETGEEVWTASLPSVPLSAMSASGRVLQSFVAPSGSSQSWASVLFLPSSSTQPGSTFVLPRPLPAELARDAPSQILPRPATRSGKYTVPAVGPGLGPGHHLVPVGTVPRHRSPFEGIACGPSVSDRPKALQPGSYEAAGGNPYAVARYSESGVPMEYASYENCETCALPPLPAPSPTPPGALKSFWSFAGASYLAVFVVAMLIGAVAALPLTAWVRRLVGSGSPGTVRQAQRGGAKGRMQQDPQAAKAKGAPPPKRRGRRGGGKGIEGAAGRQLADSDENGAESDSQMNGLKEHEAKEDASASRPARSANLGTPVLIERRRSKEGQGRSGPGQARTSQEKSEEEGMRVGRLVVKPEVIGYGSHGTLVLEGMLEGRPVAVKRLLSQFYEKARKEIAALIATDEHPNVVRCFAMEEDGAFVYVALERCTMSLADLITACAKAQGGLAGSQKLPGSNARPEMEIVHTGMEAGPHEAAIAAAASALVDEGVRLWDDSAFPTPTLIGILRDIVSGLAHLHDQRIVHRDLKPQNVLILVQSQHCRSAQKKRPSADCTSGDWTAGTSIVRLRAKLSDMGISKRLADEASSYDHHTAGSGSSGWQAPEQLREGQRQTRSVDMFPLGCLLFYCISGGQHPFGARYERDANVLGGRSDLFPVEHVPEAEHLIGLLLQKDPSVRPTAAEVLTHPLFWSAETRLSFLRDASDRVEGEDRVEGGSPLLDGLEGCAREALGIGQWKDKIDAALLGNLGMYRRYNFRSVRDLLRVIRNKCNHYRELPEVVQELLGPVPEGYESYFRHRFPRLLIEVWLVLREHCFHDPLFQRYFLPVPISGMVY